MNFAQQLSTHAREITLPHFRSGIHSNTKADDSPVTIADRDCEAAMRTLIADTYPTHGVVGEEYGDDSANCSDVWVLDPIDGTRSFITGSRQYCTLIAFVRDGIAQIGLIDMPAENECWLACDVSDKQSVTLNGKPCVTSTCHKLSESSLVTTTLGVADNACEAAAKRLCRSAGQMRLGGDASAYGCVASGYADIAVDYKMACHDYLPLVPIVRAAGGVISDWQGETLQLSSTHRTEVLASATIDLHQQALSTLNMQK